MGRLQGVHARDFQVTFGLQRALGPPIREKPAEPKAEWLKVPGKPHLRRHSISGALKTYIPANEVVNAPYGWLGGVPVVDPE